MIPTRCVQHYRIKATTEHLTEAKPGQFVMDESSEQVLGFIDYVSDTHMAVMFFDPQWIPDDEILPEGFEILADEVDWETRLEEILIEDPSMNELWTRE